MTKAVPDILARIVDHKAQELKQVTVSRSVLDQQAERASKDRRDFAGGLKARRPAIIAESWI